LPKVALLITSWATLFEAQLQAHLHRPQVNYGFCVVTRYCFGFEILHFHSLFLSTICGALLIWALLMSYYLS